MVTPKPYNTTRARTRESDKLWWCHDASPCCLWSSSSFLPIDNPPARPIAVTACLPLVYETRGLGAIPVVLPHLFAIARLHDQPWECHGKIATMLRPSRSFDRTSGETCIGDGLHGLAEHQGGVWVPGGRSARIGRISTSPLPTRRPPQNPVWLSRGGLAMTQRDSSVRFPCAAVCRCGGRSDSRAGLLAAAAGYLKMLVPE
jgi:hypothetical protein